MRASAVAFIADPHLHESDDDRMERLARTLQDIDERRDVGLTVVLGDLLWRRPFEEFRTWMARFTTPYRIIPGNHDREHHAAFDACFGPYPHSFEHGGCLFLALANALDADEPDRHRGDWGEAQADWVERTLHAEAHAPSRRPVVLLAHVPPLHGSAEEHAFHLREHASEQFSSWCRRFGIAAACFGHLHHAEHFVVEQTPCHVVPSLSWNFDSSGSSDRLRPFWHGEQVARGGYTVMQIDDGSLAMETCWT